MKADPAARPKVILPWLNARKKRAARIAYSPTCAHLRTKSCAVARVASEMPGLSQRKNGTRNREVCSEDIKSVEQTNMKMIQSKMGSQYIRSRRIENETIRQGVVLIWLSVANPSGSAARFSTDLYGAGLGGAS